MDSKKLIIEGNGQSVILTPSGLHNGSEQRYHYRKLVRGSVVKIWICHTENYCKQMKINCCGQTAVKLSNYRFRCCQLVGNANTFNICADSNDTHSEMCWKPCSACFEIQLGGIDNRLLIDTSCFNIEELKLFVNSDSRPVNVSNCSQYIELIGSVHRLFIKTGRPLHLDAQRLTVSQMGSLHLLLSGLLKTLKKPLLVNGALWNQTEVSAPRCQPKPKCKSKPRAKNKATTNSRASKLTVPAHCQAQVHDPGLSLCACSICVQNFPNVLCAPCGHAICVNCARFLYVQKKQTVCAMIGCSSAVEQLLPLFLQMQRQSGDTGSDEMSVIDID